MCISQGDVRKPIAPIRITPGRFIYKEMTYRGVGGLWGNQRAERDQHHLAPNGGRGRGC